MKLVRRRREVQEGIEGEGYQEEEAQGWQLAMMNILTRSYMHIWTMATID